MINAKLHVCRYIYIYGSETVSHSVISNYLWSHGQAPLSIILEARIMEWVAMPFSRESSQPRDWTRVSFIAGRFFTIWAIRQHHHPPAHTHTHTHTHIRVFVLSHFSRVWLFATLWTVALQASLSMGILQAGILEWVAMSSSPPDLPLEKFVCRSGSNS